MSSSAGIEGQESARLSRSLRVQRNVVVELLQLGSQGVCGIFALCSLDLQFQFGGHELEALVLDLAVLHIVSIIQWKGCCFWGLTCSAVFSSPEAASMATLKASVSASLAISLTAPRNLMSASSMLAMSFRSRAENLASASASQFPAVPPLMERSS